MRPSPHYSEMRRAVIRLAIGVVAVHAVFIALYYLAGVPGRARSEQQIFVGAWLAVTAAVVLPGLKRVRSFRRRR